MAEAPLIVIIFRLLISCIGTFAGFWLLPGYYYMAMATKIIRHSSFLITDPKKRTSSDIQMYGLLWAPRWLLAFGTPVVWLGTILIITKLLVLSFLFFFHSEFSGWNYSFNPFSFDVFSDFVSMSGTACLVSLVVLGYGWYYMQTSWLKLIPDVPFAGETGYVRNCLEAQFDFVAFVLFSFSLCFLVRIPFLYHTMKYILENKEPHIRQRLAFEIVFALWDFVIFVAAVFHAVFGFYRVKETLHIWKTDTKGFEIAQVAVSSKARAFTLAQAFSTFLDYPFWVMAAFCGLAPWHYARFRNAAKNSIDLKDLRIVWLQNFGLVLAEIAAIICGLICGLSIYRAYPMSQIFSKKASAEDRIKFALFQFELLVVDICCIFFLLCIIVPGHRLVFTFWKVTMIGTEEYIVNWSFYTMDVQEIIYGEWIEWVKDWPYILMATIVTVLLWRAPYMLYLIYHSPGKTREIISDNFFMLFVDLFDLPFWILTLPIWLTLWRAPNLFKKIKNCSSRGAFRKVVLVQLFQWVLDFPCSLAACIVFVSLWRARILYNELNRLYQQEWKTSPPEAEANTKDKSTNTKDKSKPRQKAQEEEEEEAENPKPKEQRRWPLISEWHYISLRELLFFIIDIPFFLLTIFVGMAPWRWAILKQILRDPMDEWARKKLILMQAAFLVIDLPALICSLILLVSWRSLMFIRDMKAATITTNKHEIIFNQFWNLMVDFPFVVLGICSGWRIPQLWGQLRREAETDWDRRKMAVATFLNFFKDIPCAFLLCIMVLTLWRIPMLKESWQKYEKGDHEHIIILKHFMQWLIDLPFGICALIVLPTWRGRSLIRHSNRCKAWWAVRGGALVHFALLLTDFIAIILFILGILPLVRITTFVYWVKWAGEYMKLQQFHHTINNASFKEIIHDEPITWEYTIKFYIASVITAGQVLYDIAGLVGIATIFATGFLVPDFIKSVLTFITSRNDPNLDTKKFPEIPECNKHSQAEWIGIAVSTIPSPVWTLSSIRPILWKFTILSGSRIHHWLLLPFKALGVVFLPLHMILAKVRLADLRAKQKAADERRGSEENTFSGNFFFQTAMALNGICSAKLNFWGMDQVFFLSVVCLCLIALNTAAVVSFLVSLTYIFTVTFGAPLWEKRKVQLFHPLVIVALENVSLLLQVFLSPLYMLLQVALAFLPAIYFSQLGQRITSVEAAVDRFLEFSFQELNLAEDSPISHEVFFFVTITWCVCVTLSWKMVYNFTTKRTQLFRPFGCYGWLLSKLFSGKLWGIYKYLLSYSTGICFKLRRFLFLGELLMFPVFLVWVGWPLLIPYYQENEEYKVLYYAFAPVILFLAIKGIGIVSGAWHDPNFKLDPKPICQIVSIKATLKTKVPDHGIQFIIQGTKPPDFVLSEAQLSLEGEKLWSVVEDIVGSTVVSFAKFAVLPVDLCPNYMTKADFKKGSKNFFTQIHFGDIPSLRISHKTLLEKLRGLEQRDDPEFVLSIAYGERGFGFSKLGTLMEIRSSMSKLLKAAENDLDLELSPLPYKQE